MSNPTAAQVRAVQAAVTTRHTLAAALESIKDLEVDKPLHRFYKARDVACLRQSIRIIDGVLRTMRKQFDAPA